MRVLQNRKGFSIVELLIVIVIVAFIALIVGNVTLGVIDDARGTALIAEARMVYTTAILVSAEAGTLRDADLARGISGAANDDLFEPVQTELSRRMNELLAPNVVLSDEPGDGIAKATFEVRNGAVVSLVYEAMYGSRRYAVTFTPGGEATAERVN